jgi:hypothetical protein
VEGRCEEGRREQLYVYNKKLQMLTYVRYSEMRKETRHEYKCTIGTDEDVFSTLMIGPASSVETSVTFYQTIWCNILVCLYNK